MICRKAAGFAATPLLLSDNWAILVYIVRLGQAVLERLLSGRCLFENCRTNKWAELLRSAFRSPQGPTIAFAAAYRHYLPRYALVTDVLSREGGRTLRFHGLGSNTLDGVRVAGNDTSGRWGGSTLERITDGLPGPEQFTLHCALLEKI